MKLSILRQTWSQAVRDNRTKNILIVVLAFSTLLAVVGWLETEKTIVLVPPFLDERMQVSSSKASEGYKKAWALTLAQLAGNVTPATADFVLDTLGNLLSPDVYRKLAAELATQATDIKRDSLTVTFEPRQVQYEPQRDRVWVTGQFSSQGVSGAPKKGIRTYEMTVVIRMGRPWITSFAAYAGMPVTDSASKAGTARAAEASEGGAS